MSDNPSSSIRLGKIKSKYLISIILGNSFYIQPAKEFLHQVNQNTRLFLIQQKAVMDAFLEKRCEKCKQIDCDQDCEQCDYCKGWDSQWKRSSVWRREDIKLWHKCRSSSSRFEYCSHCERLLPERSLYQYTDDDIFCEDCWVKGCGFCNRVIGSVQDRDGKYYCKHCFGNYVCDQAIHEETGYYADLRCDCQACGGWRSRLCKRCCERINGANSENGSTSKEFSGIDEVSEGDEDEISYASEEENGEASIEEKSDYSKVKKRDVNEEPQEQ
ncbi:hypothetical protein FGO68_gene5698 [Halteria grandinella]|uniref:Uncharacterized protein n=1 Tax=Halteria grandinella TaxID=5974 RepID=A0A8J8NM47_HALGN|nr:hypothetical protein FGO68_gene5698 [Halteria grandinella]